LSASYKSIQIVIDEKGKVHIRTSGFVGKVCLEEAEKLIALLQQSGLDVKTEDVKLTAEAYQVAEKSGVKVKR